MHHHPVHLTLCCFTLSPSLTHHSVPPSPSRSSLIIQFLMHTIKYMSLLHNFSCDMLFHTHHVVPPTLFSSSLTFLSPTPFSFAHRNYITTSALVVWATVIVRLMAAYCTLTQCTGGGKDRQMASRPCHPRCRPTSDAFV